MKYSTTTKINNMGFYELLEDIKKNDITPEEWKEVRELLTREQKQELRQELWEEAVNKILYDEDFNELDYMGKTTKYVYENMGETDSLPF